MKILSEDTLKQYSNTIGRRNEVDNVMALPLFIQTVMGQNVLDPSWCWKTKLWKHIFMAFLVIYVIIGTKDYLKTATDTTSIGEAYYTIVLTFFFGVKYFLFVINRVAFRTLYLSAKTTLLEILKTDSIELLNKTLKNIKVSMLVILISAAIPVFIYLLAALWKYVFGTRATLSKTTTTLMPMTTPYFELGLTLHFMFLFMMAFTYMIIDLWFVTLMIFFCAAYDAMVRGLNIKPKASDETDLEYGLRLNNNLKMFYINHNHSMEYLNILKDVYKWPALIPLITTFVNTCLILFLMTENIQWTFLTNLLPTIMELFAYNWCGEQLKDKVAQLKMALLHFEWTSMCLKDKKNYLIIMNYMTNEFCIRTAVGDELSLYTMSAVMKASYQAFAVLKSMES